MPLFSNFCQLRPLGSILSLSGLFKVFVQLWCCLCFLIYIFTYYLLNE